MATIVNLGEIVTYLFPAARAGIDFLFTNDGSGQVLSLWNPALGTMPTLAILEANRAATQAAQDAAAAAEAQAVTERASAKAVVSDMINGVGTNAERIARLEKVVGRMIKDYYGR